MTAPFMRAYALLLIKTCHRRGAFAMGGMAAQIPIKNDPAANEAAIAKVRADKEREANDGHDGTWVAHPGLVRRHGSVRPAHAGTNQIARKRDDVKSRPSRLLDFQPEAPITEQACGTTSTSASSTSAPGSPARAACRSQPDGRRRHRRDLPAQIWQWISSPKGVLDDGRKITKEIVRKFLAEELAKVRALVGEDGWNAGEYAEAARLFDASRPRMTTSSSSLCPATTG